MDSKAWSKGWEGVGGGCRRRDVSSHSPLGVRVRLKEHICIIYHHEKANKYMLLQTVQAEQIR
jgi:hypothetical protein